MPSRVAKIRPSALMSSIYIVKYVHRMPHAINDSVPSINVKTCLKQFLFSRENVMQYPIRCPYNGQNFTVPMPLLPMEKGAVIKCPVKKTIRCCAQQCSH